MVTAISVVFVRHRSDHDHSGEGYRKFALTSFRAHQRRGTGSAECATIAVPLASVRKMAAVLALSCLPFSLEIALRLRTLVLGSAAVLLIVGSNPARAESKSSFRPSAPSALAQAESELASGHVEALPDSSDVIDRRRKLQPGTAQFAASLEDPKAETAHLLSELDQAMRSGKFAEVVDRSQSALDALRETQDPDAEIRLRAMRGMALSNLGRRREAADEFVAVAAGLGHIGNGTAQVRALGAAALFSLDAGTPERAAALLHDAVRTGANETHRPSDAAASLKQIAGELATRHREDLAEPLAETAVMLARRSSPGSLALAEELALLGFVEDETKKPNAARVHLAEALALRDKLDPQSVDTSSSLETRRQ